MTGWVGFPGVWIGIAHTSDLGVSVCFCKKGHDWLASAKSYIFDLRLMFVSTVASLMNIGHGILSMTALEYLGLMTGCSGRCSRGVGGRWICMLGNDGHSSYVLNG